MKIGLIPVNIGVANAEQMVRMSQVAESVGVESVWTFEHVIVPVDYKSKYPYSPNGKMGATPETNFIDPLIALAVGCGADEEDPARHRRQHSVADQSAADGEAGGEPRSGVERPLHARRRHRLAAGRVRRDGHAVRTPRRALRRLRRGDEEGVVRRRGGTRQRVSELARLQELSDSGAAPARAGDHRRREGQDLRTDRDRRRRLVRAGRRSRGTVEVAWTS